MQLNKIFYAMPDEVLKGMICKLKDVNVEWYDTYYEK